MAQVIKVSDINDRILRLRSKIDKEKNTIEKKRLMTKQASLIETLTEMHTYSATITSDRGVRSAV